MFGLASDNGDLVFGINGWCIYQKGTVFVRTKFRGAHHLNFVRIVSYSILFSCGVSRSSNS